VPPGRKPLDAGPFAPEIGSFRLLLAAKGKAAKTVRTYVEAVACSRPRMPATSSGLCSSSSAGWRTKSRSRTR